ncbi:MAG: hypothetical protein NBV65_11290 [Burkholderiaceae bacterium]|nr:hypothetical protein [Burkholderiaceae bacterium]
MSVSFPSGQADSSLPIAEQEKDQKKSPPRYAKTVDGDDAGAEKKNVSTPGIRTRKKLDQLKAQRKPDAPIVRTKLTKRERSVSSPLIVRPVSDSVSPTASFAQIPGSSSVNAVDAVLPVSTPRLRTTKPNPVRKSLTPEQRLASDLADLIDKKLLSAHGRADDELDVSQLPKTLQSAAGKPSRATVRITDLMLNVFSQDMKDSGGWELASQIMVSIRRTYFRGRDESSVLDPREEKEATDTLAALAGVLAGAFFNVSGSDRNRLPDSLRHFLHEVDHRQIRRLLSGQGGIRLSHEKFMQARKDCLATAMLDAFLIPLLMKEFSLTSRTIASAAAASHIIHALHTAFTESAPTLLATSLASPPDDIAALMMQRLQRQNRLGQGDTPEKNSPTAKAVFPRTLSPLTATASLRGQRREVLKQLLEQTVKSLAPEVLSDEMLKAIRTANREWVESDEPIDDLVLLAEWLDLVQRIDSSAAAVKTLQALVNDRTYESSLSQSLLEIDLYAKLAEIEASGWPLPVERARRLSSNLPMVRALPVVPPMAQQGKASASETPVSRPTRHKRSKTADVALPVGAGSASELTPRQSAELIRLFPDLLLGCVKNAARVRPQGGENFRPDPIRGIWEIGRNKFEIAASDIPLPLRVKLFPSSMLVDQKRTISHTALWKMLMMEALKASPPGVAIVKHRRAALDRAGQSLTVEALAASPEQIEEKKVLKEKFQPKTNALVSRLFGQGLATAGLPDQIIESCRSIDRKLMAWIAEELLPAKPTISPEAIDELRSKLVFDLLITRLLYPLVMPADGLDASVNGTNYASAFGRSMKTMWDQRLFNDFKSIQRATDFRAKDDIARDEGAEAEPGAHDD